MHRGHLAYIVVGNTISSGRHGLNPLLAKAGMYYSHPTYAVNSASFVHCGSLVGVRSRDELECWLADEVVEPYSASTICLADHAGSLLPLAALVVGHPLDLQRVYIGSS